MCRFRLMRAVFALCLFAPVVCSSQEANVNPFTYPPSYDVGKPISESTLSQLFTTIPPDGAGLPAGSGTFESGKRIYEAQCLACHGDQMQGTDAGSPLVGGRGSLTSESPRKTVESFWPYATSVYSYIRNAMPVTAPGSLTNDEVYSLMAYILGSAQLVPRDVIMDKNVLVEVEMPNRNGFFPDNRPDVEP